MTSWSGLATLATLALSVALAGCGDGASHPSSQPALRPAAGATTSTGNAAPPQTSGPAAHPAGASSEPVSLGQAISYAGAVNLTPDDYAESQAAHSEGSGKGSRTPSRLELERCTGHAHVAQPLASRSSQLLVRGSELEVEGVGSEVEVMRDRVSATSTFALAARLVDNPHVRACLAGVLDRQFGGGHLLRDVHFDGLTISTLPMQVPGFSSAFGVRFLAKATFELQEVTLPSYVDVYSFRAGAALVTLFTISFTQPVPGQVEQGLLDKLAARARARAAAVDGSQVA